MKAVQDELTGESASFTELLVQAKSTKSLNNAAAEVESILAAENNTTVANLPFTVVNQGALLSTAQSTKFLPYVVALVDLDAGVRVMARADGPPGDVATAMRVTVFPDPDPAVGPGLLFTPEPAGPGGA